jgi:3-phytase
VSAEKFIQGFQQARQRDPKSTYRGPPPSVGVIVSEEGGSNNTLNHGLCDAFENSDPSGAVQAYFANIFAGPILTRVNKNLEGANLSVGDIISLLDLCPFYTLASTPDGAILSPFCSLFTRTEWAQYDYYQSLGKYYGYGNGNPLGPTQGVGFVNELIARLTGKPVVDPTSVNHTLDADLATFPLDSKLYADFSHDNAMTSIFSGLGLYNDTPPLSDSTVRTAEQLGGYSAAWTVPFAARAYVEKMQCSYPPEPLVRILVNDRVVPLRGCHVDRLGRCTLDDFIAGLSFARDGGHWDQCFI